MREVSAPQQKSPSAPLPNTTTLLHPSCKLQLIPGAVQQERRCYLLLRPSARRPTPSFKCTHSHIYSAASFATLQRTLRGEKRVGERKPKKKKGSSQQARVLFLLPFSRSSFSPFFLIYRAFLRKLHCSPSLSLIRPFVADYHSGRQRAGNV